MVVKKQYVLCVLAVVFVAVGMYAHKNKPYDQGSDSRTTQQRCATKKDCLENQNCQCYCAEVGDFRKKTAEDKPVYVENDPNGVYCYCKQWDLDKYPGPVERK